MEVVDPLEVTAEQRADLYELRDKYLAEETGQTQIGVLVAELLGVEAGSNELWKVCSSWMDANWEKVKGDKGVPIPLPKQIVVIRDKAANAKLANKTSGNSSRGATKRPQKEPIVRENKRRKDSNPAATSRSRSTNNKKREKRSPPIQRVTRSRRKASQRVTEVEDEGGEDDEEEERMVDEDAEGEVPGTTYNKAIEVIGGNRIGASEAYPQEEEKVQFSGDKVFPGIKLYLRTATNWRVVDEKGNDSVIMTSGNVGLFLIAACGALDGYSESSQRLAAGWWMPDPNPEERKWKAAVEIIWVRIPLVVIKVTPMMFRGVEMNMLVATSKRAMYVLQSPHDDYYGRWSVCVNQYGDHDPFTDQNLEGEKPDYIDQPNWDDLVRDHRAFKTMYPGMLDQQPPVVEEYDRQVYAAELSLQYALLQLRQVTHLDDQDREKIAQLERHGTRDPKLWRQQQERIKKVEELEKKIESRNITREEAQNRVNIQRANLHAKMNERVSNIESCQQNAESSGAVISRKGTRLRIQTPPSEGPSNTAETTPPGEVTMKVDGAVSVNQNIPVDNRSATPTPPTTPQAISRSSLSPAPPQEGTTNSVPPNESESGRVRTATDDVGPSARSTLSPERSLAGDPQPSFGEQLADLVIDPIADERTRVVGAQPTSGEAEDSGLFGGQLKLSDGPTGFLYT
ncbi:hypothetical protein FRC11_009008 [Ceratobasidium sp. 423]|nr:hypothetical protein FRC11_009008 [Ceratobasidium sp. 423]